MFECIIYYVKKHEAEILMSIILIGLPSCGKSTIGVILAKRLGYKFIDSDLLIQEKEGKLLHDIIAERGNDGFLALENEVNAAINEENAVIATGGSAVYGKEAMEHFKGLGTVIYLKISFRNMSRRLGDYVHRGVVMRDGQNLYSMYRERCALYEKYADIVIDEGNGRISNTLSLIECALTDFNSAKKDSQGQTK